MDEQFTSRDQVDATVISLLSDLRAEEGLNLIHLDDDSPIFSHGMEHGGQLNVNLVLELESVFGINITDDPSILDTLGTIGDLTDYIMERMQQTYER